MEKQQQTKTYQTRQQIRRSVRDAKLGWHHYRFVFNFLKKSLGKVTTLISLLIVEAAIEISTLTFAGGSLRERAYENFHNGNLLPILFIAVVGVACYLAVSFFALKIERTMVVQFINMLRRNWFLLILGQPPHAITYEKGADLIAKTSYHFPLVSLGIDHSALGTMRLILCASIVVAAGSIGGGYLFLGSIGIVCLGLLIGLIAYFVANHYISQEVASYSRVIRHIDSSLSEIGAIKTFGQEKASIHELDARVNTDTYFRIRRDIWLRYFTKIVYAVIFVSAFTLAIISFYYPGILLQWYVADDALLVTVMSLYSLKFFYESGRTGLYIPPLRLGLSLSIPETPPRDIKAKKEKTWSIIEFRSNKIKLHVEGGYFKRMIVRLEKGRRYLFFGSPYIGKTSLAEVIAGSARFNRNGWLVKVDEQRFNYRQWSEQFSGSFFISPYFHSEKTLGEIIFAKDKQLITAEDLFSIYAHAEKHPTLAMIVSKKRFVGESLRVFEANSQLLFAAYVLHCLVSKPNLISIDNQWLDLGYPEINSMISLLSNELPQSTLVVFSRKNNDTLSYDETYEISHDQIERYQEKV